MTAVYAEVKLVGIKEAVKELNNIDKSARRELTREYKRIVESVISEAKQRIPLGAPVSGWNRSWTTKSGKQLLPWDACVPRLPAYCQALQLAPTAADFVAALRERLRETAARVDATYPANTARLFRAFDTGGEFL